MTNHPINRWLKMTNAELRLQLGELTAQEIRTIRAVLSCISNELQAVEKINAKNVANREAAD
jgi:hypothetical protein